MNKLSGQRQRRLLLGSSLAYAVLLFAVPGVFLVHEHLTGVVALAASMSATILFIEVVGYRDGGTRRGRLAWQLLLAGPLAPAVVARRTRRWRPVLLVRPVPGRRT